MNKNSKTKQQLLLEAKQLRTRLDATERRLQEANEILQTQIAERKRGGQTFEKAQKYIESIVETIREPLLVLASDLRVLSANRSFYDTFKVTLKETTGNLIYNLGNRQWDIPRLRTLLEDILTKNNEFDNYEVEHVFSNIGHKIMLFNARRIIQKEIGSQMILLAIEDITEHRQLKSLLEGNEAKYRELVQNANSIILKMDPEGKVTFFNEFAQMFFGYIEEEMLGRSVVGTIIPETGSSGLDPDFMIKDIGINPKKYITNENENMRRNGERVWVAWTNKAIRDGNGKVIEILCIGNDITERRRLEILLSESEERYRRLFETANDGILLLEKNEGNITHANPAVTAMLGYSKEECIGNKLQDIGFSHDMGDFQEIMHTLDRSGIIYYDDVPIKTKVGQTFYVDIYLVDRARLVQCNIRDITERKQAEETLRESEERYRMAIESSSDGVAIIKGDVHLYVNQRFAEIFGYENPQEIIGKTYTITVHPDDIETVKEISLKRQQGEAVPSRYEFKGIRKDGQKIYIEASSAKTTYKGEPVALTYIRDVTERKKAKQEMLSLQEQLRQSQKMEAIGTLAGGIAHDFNNILSAILGYAEIASFDIAEGTKAKHNLEHSIRAAHRAKDLVQQILAFSRQGRQERKLMSIKPIVQEGLKFLRASLPTTIEIQ